MGAVFGVVFFVFLLIIGGIIGVCGISLLTIAVIRKKKGKKAAGFLISSVISLILSFVIIMIPLGFFGMIYLMNTLPPDNYIETDIVIEENGYQDTTFTADGRVYHVLPYEFNYSLVYDAADTSDNILTPVFSYKTAGFLNGSQCGNYYAVKNNNGFELICSQNGSLFCTSEQRDAIRSYYDAPERVEWYLQSDDFYKHIRLAESSHAFLTEFFFSEKEHQPNKNITLKNTASRFLHVIAVSDDLIIIYKYGCLTYHDGSYSAVLNSKLSGELLKCKIFTFENEMSEALKKDEVLSGNSGDSLE